MRQASSAWRKKKKFNSMAFALDGLERRKDDTEEISEKEILQVLRRQDSVY
jgi:hypothetical protein